MSWLGRTLQSSIGGKWVVALTGLGLVGFLVAHLAGNLLVFAGPQALNDYAAGLRKFPALLLAARVGLVAIALLHIFFAVKLNLKNRAARPVAYSAKTYVKASLQSRTMVLTGVLVLVYALWHLADLTWRLTDSAVQQLGPFDAYQMVVLRFSNPLNSLFYILMMVVTGIHVSHGVQSVFQTFGLNHHKYNRCFRSLGPLLGSALAILFMAIPISVLLGIVK